MPTLPDAQASSRRSASQAPTAPPQVPPGPLHTATAGVARDNDMPDTQVQQCEFQDGLHVGVLKGYLVRDVPVHEKLTRFGPDHAVQALSAIGTTEEQERRPLALCQLGERVRSSDTLALHPGSVFLE